jgi:hypothetical protein
LNSKKSKKHTRFKSGPKAISIVCGFSSKEVPKAVSGNRSRKGLQWVRDFFKFGDKQVFESLVVGGYKLF